MLLPAALPPVLTGLHNGLSLAWMFMVAAELIAASCGLGYLLTDGRETGRADIMLAATVLPALLGKLSDSAMGMLERRSLIWRAPRRCWDEVGLKEYGDALPKQLWRPGAARRDRARPVSRTARSESSYVLRICACDTLLPGGTLWVSHTLPPMVDPAPTVIRPRMVAPA